MQLNNAFLGNVLRNGNSWHWSVLPGAPFYKTNEHIQFKCTSQTAIVAELIVGHDGKGHRESALMMVIRFAPSKNNN